MRVIHTARVNHMWGLTTPVSTSDRQTERPLCPVLWGHSFTNALSNKTALVGRLMGVVHGSARFKPRPTTPKGPGAYAQSGLDWFYFRRLLVVADFLSRLKDRAMFLRILSAANRDATPVT